MKLVELLYQNRDKFTLHDDCRWLSQDADRLVNMHTNLPGFNGINYTSDNFINYAGLEGKSALKVDICDDIETPLSRSDYEQYCKEQDAKLLSDIDNALIRHEQCGALESGFLYRSYAYERDIPADGIKDVAVCEKIKSDGSTASYYKLPGESKELQDLISHRNMNAQIGEIFRACYRYGLVSHSDMLRDAKKIKFYADAEIKRLEKEIANNG